ncbi:MAG: hypothetical protein IKI62_07810 [Clostridia bacterium]|nr:hypothetical protein [Clostridia bacterium]
MDITLIETIIDEIERDLITHKSNAEISNTIYTKYPHAKKMFSVILGISIRQYIIKRRLSIIAKDILTTDDKIEYICHRYGMKGDAFSKSFSNEYNLLPRQIRDQNVHIDYFERFSFSYHNSYEDPVFPRIIQKTFPLFKGIKYIIPYEHSMDHIRSKEIMISGELDPTTNEYYAVATDFADDDDNFEYFISIPGNEGYTVSSSSSFECNQKLWALFRIIDNQTNMNDFFRYVTPFWSRNNNKYVISDHYVIEHNYKTENDHSVKDVYIPIKSME